MWGARLFEPGTDRGGHFLIKKSPLPNDPEPVGPNLVILEERVEKQRNDSNISVNSTLSSPTLDSTETGDDNLWKILQATVKVLNETHPNLTSDCWLCYTLKPPFYEAIGITTKAKRVNGTNPARCLWRKKKDIQRGITLSKVTGKGRCIGQVPPEKKSPVC